MKPGALNYLLFVLMAVGCTEKRESEGPKYGEAQQAGDMHVYHFAVHPLHNPNKLMQEYQPLIDYLNSRIVGAHFVLEASRDYASFEEKYKNRGPEFLLPNPWQTLQAMKVGYNVMATAGEPRDFRGFFIVHKDNGIQTLQDLHGKAISYPSMTALAACIMPQYYLFMHGIDVNHDIENHYVGSQESSILNVYLNITSVGVTWPPPWRAFQKDYPKEAAQLKIAWETESLINNSVMSRDDVPTQIRAQVFQYLTGLQETDSGKQILANMETARFIPASDQDYDVVRTYVEALEKHVRKVEYK